MNQINAQTLFQNLKNDNIVNSIGKIIFSLNSINVTIETKDSVGHMLQDWLEAWATKNNTYLRANPSTQEFPDFFLSSSNEDNLLEIKSFDFKASPNFDIANFDTYTRSLLDNPKKVDADYLVFGYSLTNGVLKIEGIWLKKIWELSTKSDKWALKLQVKQDTIYNIRPVNFVSTRPNIAQPFNSRKDFLEAVQDVLNNYSKTATTHTNWLTDYKQKYQSLTGNTI